MIKLLQSWVDGGVVLWCMKHLTINEHISFCRLKCSTFDNVFFLSVLCHVNCPIIFSLFFFFKSFNHRHFFVFHNHLSQSICIAHARWCYDSLNSLCLIRGAIIPFELDRIIIWSIWSFNATEKVAFRGNLQVIIEGLAVLSMLWDSWHLSLVAITSFNKSLELARWFLLWIVKRDS